MNKDRNKNLVNFTKGDPRINRNGRPPNSKIISDALLEKLNQRNGRDQLKKIVEKLYAEANKGNMKAIEIILDRIEGKAIQPIVGDLNLPINLIFQDQRG